MHVTIPTTGQTIELPDGATQADIEEAVQYVVDSRSKDAPQTKPAEVANPVSVPATRAGLWDTVSGLVRQGIKATVGAGEAIANQATQIGALSVAGVPAMLGAAGSEIADSIVNQRLPKFQNISDKFFAELDPLIYKPHTESGIRTNEDIQGLLKVIPEGVDALDDATGERFKKNFPNAYAATQVAGETLPFIVGGKMVHSAFKGPVEVMRTIPPKALSPAVEGATVKEGVNEILKSRGVPEAVADELATKASAADFEDSRTAETVAEQLDAAVKAAQEHPQQKQAPEAAIPSALAAETAYEFKRWDSTEPNRSTVYHGTKAPIDDISKIDTWNYGDPNALFFDGAYVTDNPNIAAGYAKTKGMKGQPGKVLVGNLKGVKLLDLEKPLGDSEYDAFKTFFEESLGYREDGIDAPTSRDPKELIRMAQEDLADRGYTKYSAAEVVDDLRHDLGKLGYQGFSHIGGGKSLNGKVTPQHNVAILWEGTHDINRPGDPYGRTVANMIEPKSADERKPVSPPTFEQLKDLHDLQEKADALQATGDFAAAARVEQVAKAYREEVAKSNSQSGPQPETELNPKEPKYVPFKFSPDERAALTATIDSLVNEDGTVNPVPGDSLINLRRVSGTEEQKALHQAIGEAVREKVKERLGEDSGKLEEIQNRVYRAIAERNGKETGMDFLKAADKTSLELQRLAIETQLVRERAAAYVKELARRKAVAAKSDASIEDKLMYLYYREKALNFVGLDAEIARQQSWTFNSRKIEASGEGVEINDLEKEDLETNPALKDQLLASLEKVGGLDELDKLIQEHLDAADLPGTIRDLKAKHPQVINVALELSGLNLLSSVYGRVRDTIHNIVRPVADLTETSIAAGVGKLRGRAVADRITGAEVSARVAGNWAGTMEALTRSFSEVYRGAKNVPEWMQEHDTPIKVLAAAIDAAESVEHYVDNAGFLHGKTKAVIEGVGRKYIKGDYIKGTIPGEVADKILKGLGKTVGLNDSVATAVWKLVDVVGAIGRVAVYGTIKYTDLPSEYMGYDTEVYGLAAREVAKRGLAGQAAEDLMTRLVSHAQALRDDIKLPDAETRADRTIVKAIHEAAMKNALETTLKGELESEWARDIEAFMNNHSAGKLTKLVVNQFFSTTARLFKYQVQRNILTAWASKGMRDSLSGLNGPQAQDLATAKLIFGTAAQAVALELVLNGYITGYSTHRKEARDAGVLDFAFYHKPSGRLYQFNQADPFGGFVSTVAAATYGYMQTKNGTIEERLNAIFGNMVNDQLGRSYLKSLLDLKTALQDQSGKGFMKFLQSHALTLLPLSGLLTSSRDMLGNDTMRAVDNFKDQVLRIYHPDELDADPDLYGKVMHSPDRTWGMRTSTPALGSARMEVLKHGIKLPEAPDVLDAGVKMSPYSIPLDGKKKREYLRSLADPKKNIRMEDRLEEAVRSPAYRAASPEVQGMLLNNIIRNSHDAAKADMLKQPETVRMAITKANAVGKLLTDHTDLNWKGNWMEFLTGKQTLQRETMTNGTGLRKK